MIKALMIARRILALGTAVGEVIDEVVAAVEQGNGDLAARRAREAADRRELELAARKRLK